MARSHHDLTIVCCVEAGRLEEQTLLMTRSLRAFGGEFAKVPVIAVVGRQGPPLTRQTREEFERLKVEVVRARPKDNPAAWFGYSNKAAAVVTAERLAPTSTIAWIDSDVFFAKPPKGLTLDPGCDFAARSEFLPPAVHRGSSKHIAYWEAVCGLFGVDFDAVPWIESRRDLGEQKMFFNSGVFVWRKGSDFAAAYHDAFIRLLRSRLGQADGTFHFIDQVILTPVVLGRKLAWRHLSPDEHFMIFQGFIDGPDAAPDMLNAQIIHYSRSMEAPYRDRFVGRLKKELPAFYDWLSSVEVTDRVGRPTRAILWSLKAWRGARWRWHNQFIWRCMDEGAPDVG
jgi:hypothetical protein